MKHKLFFLVLLPVLGGCGSDTPEARLESAGEKLSNTEQSLEGVEQRIDQQEQVLADLRRKRRELRSRVMTLEERVAARATDVAVFRAVQSALLEDESLTGAAISVDAEDGRVRLSGLVASAAEEQAAIALARSVPGVSSVESRIEIDAETARTR